MTTATLRKVGGSEMVALPRHVLDELGLTTGAVFNVDVADGRVVLEPTRHRRKYTLEELIAQSQQSKPASDDDRDWTAGPPAGRELL